MARPLLPWLAAAALLLQLSTLGLTSVLAQPSPDAGVETHSSRCIGPLNLASVGSVPRLCAALGFAHCDSFALNFTVTADDATVFELLEPSPLTLSYDYPIGAGSGCIGRVTLNDAVTQIITPTYVHVQPKITFLCGGYPVSSQTLDWITFVRQQCCCISYTIVTLKLRAAEKSECC
jgi:hypothetical protein